MKDRDRKAFTDALQAVYALHRADLSTAVLEIWWRALKAYDLVAVTDALGRFAMNPDTGQFLPKPADVVKMLGGSTLDSALVAWSKFDGAVQSIGTYMTVVFDDPLIHRVVDDMGGWVHLGLSTLKDWPFRQQEFLNRYRGYKLRSETPAYPPKLIGIFDGENSSHGYKVDDSNLRFIGNAQLAHQVMLGGSNVPRLGVTMGAAAQRALESTVSS